ncbi:lysophospholipid acyltransferase family protein [Nitrogeniibacter aestuarii]|uniref:lysophospholipid acyltransferase family protein n=1 Tax=Nitrogeniibacter aestuarii TaxID=2815343 RepID=UPI001D118AE2|nr:lysophospholipid acyltransferase family protein [Nitrogeniibacter aestuarii]
MHFIRSALFALVLIVITPVFALVALLVTPFSPHRRYRLIGGWTTIAMWFIRHLLGIRHKVIGQENLPQRSAVALCKHQSAWETIALQRILPPIAFVLKRELLRLPFFGWGLARMPVIAIDRAAGKDALSQVVEQGSKLLDQGFWIVVFPEGTRVAPGTTRRYKPGGAWLASHTGAPTVPIAHNAGEFWRKNAFVKQPGEIIVSIGPAIDSEGLSTEEINKRAEAWIEAEMRRLFPQHYPESAAEG